MSKPEYNLGNSPLECVDSIMLLGCIFQSNLSWDLQVQAVTSKCNRLIGLIRLISGNCPLCVSLHLFKTLVQPILDYCSPVWWIHRKKTHQFNRIGTAQSQQDDTSAKIYGTALSRKTEDSGSYVAV
jgi:hypothetical protein